MHLSEPKLCTSKTELALEKRVTWWTLTSNWRQIHTCCSRGVVHWCILYMCRVVASLSPFYFSLGLWSALELHSSTGIHPPVHDCSFFRLFLWCLVATHCWWVWMNLSAPCACKRLRPRPSLGFDSFVSQNPGLPGRLSARRAGSSHWSKCRTKWRMRCREWTMPDSSERWGWSLSRPWILWRWKAQVDLPD